MKIDESYFKRKSSSVTNSLGDIVLYDALVELSG